MDMGRDEKEADFDSNTLLPHFAVLPFTAFPFAFSV